VFVIHGTIVLGPVWQSSETNRGLGAEKNTFSWFTAHKEWVTP